ncbi:MAG: PAS domain S-box protein [Flavisolibacter sp.]
MSLQDLKKHESASKTVAFSSRSVSAFIHSKLTLLQGNWRWNLHADAVFCSDVMMSYPPDFEGTSGIIHPEDLPFVKEKLLAQNAKPGHLVFRIITTYGEVKTLEGHDIIIRQEEGKEQPTETWRGEGLQLKWQKEYANLQLLKEIYEKDERYRATGIWYYNLVTNVTWYSDEVYRIHGLPPQSLNAHLNTFNAFIHAEDKEAVQEFWARAFNQKVPLHIEYRIQTPGGEKHISYLTQWFFSPKGETVLSGIVQDITAQKQLQLQIEEAVKATNFYKQQTTFDEQNALLGHWQVNLLTRKTIFSDNYYRIHGLKTQPLAAGIDAFLNYVHTDDREVLSLVYKKMLQQQEPPQLDYRVMRTDGKLRYLSLKAKRIMHGNEVIIAGTIQDITMQKTLEKKAVELMKKGHLHSFAQRQTEELAGTATWVKEAGNGFIKWSENFCSFLNYKPDGIELSIKLLVSFIHPDDKKNFVSQLEMAEQQKEDKTFTFRLVQRGSLRYIKAFFSTRYNGETEYFAGVLHDVSREHTLRKQLQSQVQLTDALSANALDRIMVTDSSNNILLWNQQCEEFYKVKKEDALGRNFFDIFPWQKTEEEMIFFNRVLNGEKINLQEVKFSTGKGYFNLDMLPVWDEETGEVRGIVHIIHDVTKELELRKSMNERLNFISNLLEASVDRIIALDSNMNYLYWNKKAEEYYGLGSDEILGKNILEVFPAFIDDPSYSQLRQVLRGQTIHIPPQESLHNGKKYFETYLIPVKDEKEQVSVVLWIAHDLSLEYQLTKEHKETTELLKATMDSSIDMIQVFEAVRNEAGEIIDFRWILNNHSSEKYYGDVIGKSLLQQNPGVVEAGIFDTFKRVVESGIPDQSERHYAHEQFNGWFYQSVVKLNDGVATTTTDITKRKKAEQELQAAKEGLQAILDSSLYIIQAFKAVRNDEGKIIDFVWVMNNQKAVKQNGEVIGKSLLQQNPGVVPSGLFEQFVRVTESGVAVEREVHYNYEQFDGWFHLTLVKMDDGFVMNTVDVTEKKKAGQEILRLKDEIAQKATDKYEGLFRAIDDGFCVIELIYDEKGRAVDFIYRDTNPSFVKQTGFEMAGKKRSEIFADVEQHLLDNYAYVAKTGKPIEQEYMIRGLNDRWFQTRASRVGGEGSNQVAVIFRDITDRKRAEDALRQSEEKLKNFNLILERQIAERTERLEKNLRLLEHTEQLAHTGSWEYEIATGKFTWSEGMYLLFGLPHHSIVQPEVYLDFAVEKDRFIAKRIVDNLTKKHQPFEEILSIKKDGGVRLLKVKSTIVYDDEGTPQKIEGIDLDLTDIEATEKQMLESRNLLQQTTLATPDAITVYDLDTKQPVYLNNCLGQWVGCSNEELVNMEMEGRLQLIHPDDRDAITSFNERMRLAPDGEGNNGLPAENKKW